MELDDNSTDEEIAEWNARQIFVRDASPQNWLGYSCELEDAASQLWDTRGDSMEVTLLHKSDASDQITKQLTNPRAYALLAGFALENSLKAQLIVEQPAFVTNAKLHKPLKTHSLTGLMDRLNDLQFTDEERRVAETCESAIPYWGRYPVPLDFTQVESEHQIDDRFHATFLALNVRVRKHVYEQIKDGWDSGDGRKRGMMRLAEFEGEIDLNEPFLWVESENKDAT